MNTKVKKVVKQNSETRYETGAFILKPWSVPDYLTASKLWFAGDVWAFGWHAMMIGVVGTLLIIATSYLLQLSGALQSAGRD